MVRIISILAAIWFVAMGMPKLFGMPLWAIQFEVWGYIAVMIGAGFTHAINFEGMQVFKPTLSAAVLLWLILKHRQQPRRSKATAE